MEYVTLNNGVRMPRIGFGVFQVNETEICEQAVRNAISAGYRLIDTASVYGNEHAVGNAIRKSGIAREELFITTKAWVSEMGHEGTLKAFDCSLRRLGLNYIDLYLIHMPLSDYYGAWRAMEEIYNSGKARAIGVCNFGADRLKDLCHSFDVIPAVNQIEIHPFTQQDETLTIMRSLGIQAEAWAPLAEGQNELFKDHTLTSIGRKYSKTAAQVVLRWHLQRGIIAIPKSVHKERIEENFAINDFSLSADDMKLIDAMDTKRPLILDLHLPKEIDRLYDIPCTDD